ncbi:MAG TPA: septum formation initiator family protein [Actinomycetota bacterium]|nr:septum formation initiator family protein [Actinomycetota bacterium]
MSAGTRTLRRDRPRLTARAAALLVVVAILALLTLVPARQFLAQRGQIAELEAQATQLEQQNDALQREIARLKDPAELERLARECLGMVRPGEIALVTPDVPSSSDC